MEPILSKQEIADLLQTLQKDRTAVSSEGAAEFDERFVEYPEINLLNIPTSTSERSDIPHFHLILDQFCTTFSRSLSHHLQRTVSIQAIDRHSIPFSEYLAGENRSRITGVLNLPPLSSGCLLNYDSHLWLLLLENLLGAVRGTETTLVDRPPTKLELHIIRSSLELACQALDHAFHHLLQINSTIIELVSDSGVNSFTAPDVVIAVHRFEVGIDEDAGILELVFPVESLAPYKSSLEKLTRLTGLDDRDWSQQIETNLAFLPVTLMARSCSLELSIRQLVDLKVGDILPVDQKLDSPVEILVEGIPKFSGLAGHQNHKKNVKIIDIYQ